ncbi:MAG: hypothetical protein KDA84_00100, partial [Planctomycetaceae bacterium]|nr:hypothetical protein [Planctomycetaceae bacterium]
MSDSPSISPDSPKSPSRRSLIGTAVGPFLALGLVVLFFAVADLSSAGGGKFLTPFNLRSILVAAAVVG